MKGKMPEKHTANVTLQATTEVVEAKIAKLLELVSSGQLDLYPYDGFIPDFAKWSDANLEVAKFARSVLYTPNYSGDILPKVEAALKALRAARHAKERKSQAIKELEVKLKASQERGDSFVDQWAQVSADLEDALTRNAELQQDNADLRAQLAKVRPLKRAVADAVPN